MQSKLRFNRLQTEVFSLPNYKPPPPHVYAQSVLTRFTVYFVYSVEQMFCLKHKWPCPILLTKNILFWYNKYYLMKTNSMKLVKNSYYVPVLKTVRKINVYEKENVSFFKDFCHRFSIFLQQAFSE